MLGLVQHRWDIGVDDLKYVFDSCELQFELYKFEAICLERIIGIPGNNCSKIYVKNQGWMLSFKRVGISRLN